MIRIFASQQRVKSEELKVKSEEFPTGAQRRILKTELKQFG